MARDGATGTAASRTGTGNRDMYGSDAAHWEHTITVTKHGVWVLTADDGGEQALGELGIPFGPLSD